MFLWLGLILLSIHLAASTATAFALWRRDVLHWRDMATQFGPQSPTSICALLIQSRDAISQSGWRDKQWRTEIVKKYDAMIKRVPESWTEPGFGPRYLAWSLAYPALFVQDHDELMTAIREWERESWTGANAVHRGLSVKIVRFWAQPALLAGAVATLGFPALLWLLPATRRKLRIRSFHIARASIFGCAWLILPGTLRLIESTGVAIQAARATSLGFSVNGVTSYNTAPFTASWHIDWAMWAWITFAWISLWWLFALRAFRFRLAALHWLVLAIVVVLLATAFYMYTVPYDQLDYLFRVDSWWNPLSDAMDSTPRRMQNAEIDVVQW